MDVGQNAARADPIVFQQPRGFHNEMNFFVHLLFRGEREKAREGMEEENQFSLYIIAGLFMITLNSHGRILDDFRVHRLHLEPVEPQLDVRFGTRGRRPFGKSHYAPESNLNGISRQQSSELNPNPVHLAAPSRPPLISSFTLSQAVPAIIARPISAPSSPTLLIDFIEMKISSSSTNYDAHSGGNIISMLDDVLSPYGGSPRLAARCH
jgi:hypothetical protein